MKRYAHSLILNTCIMATALICFSGISYAAPSPEVCSRGLSEPPFLSLGVKANLLMILDNSGSMYDPAYVDQVGECEDSTYDINEDYAGYFDSNAVYMYDQTDEQFYATGLWDAVSACNTASGTHYYASGVACITVDETIEPHVVNAFAAKGNYLNWAATSKFDSQKKVLTGGKWDDDPDDNAATTDDGQIVMESRGCMNRRFVKQLTLDQLDSKSNPYKLTLAIRPPQEEKFDLWEDDVSYMTGDLVQYKGFPYKATIDNTTVGDFKTTEWELYKMTVWYEDVDYPPFSVVYDPFSRKMYQTRAGGHSLATATELSEDTGITDWLEYNTTHIEIFTVTTGYNDDACMDALAELGTLTGEDTEEEKTRLGVLKQLIEECMLYDQGHPNTEEGYKKSAFNHSIQECWYYDKFDRWQPGSGTISSMTTSCANLYQLVHPMDLDPSDNAYVCGGSYGSMPPYGYVGRCWEPPLGLTGTCNPIECDSNSVLQENEQCSATGFVEECVPYNWSAHKCSPGYIWKQVEICYGGGDLEDDDLVLKEGFGHAAPGGWTNDNFLFYDDCAYKWCLDNQCVTTDCTTAVADGSTCTNPTVASSTESCWNAATWTRDTDNWWISDAADSSFSGTNGYSCVQQAMRDFCGTVSIPEVIDPSDSTGLTGEVWNAPAMLTDSSIIAQLDKPILTMLGQIAQPDQPSGILQTVASDLRMGVMSFNHNGAKTECDNLGTSTTASEAINYDCPDDNRDGAQLLSKIKLGAASTGTDRTHVDDIVDSINDIKATSWTPLAEAMFNALGYYSQDGNKRLDPDDFMVTGDFNPWANNTAYAEGDIVSYDGKYWEADAAGTSSGTSPEDDTGVSWTETGVDPVTAWCQENHILVITEGASTADINTMVSGFVSTSGYNDGDTDIGTCTDGLEGSTYLDDLTYFGRNAPVSSLYNGNHQILTVDGELKDKQNITTHFVVAGEDQGDLTDECSADKIMLDSAVNGGTTKPLYANDPDALEDGLLDFFNALRQRASAGSAASVISSARGGEGAIYQAIFWPELHMTQGTDEYDVSWAGDVHGLFLDNRGFMYEDTNGDRQLRPYEDLDRDGYIDLDESLGEDIDGDGHYDCVDEDLPQPGLPYGDGHLDIDEDINGDGWDQATEDRDGDGYYDSQNEDLPQPDLPNGDGHLDTGEDFNHNGVLDPGEDINNNGTLDRTEDLDGDGGCGVPWGADGVRGTADDNFDPFIDLIQDSGVYANQKDGHQDVDEHLNYPGYSTNRDVIDGDDYRIIIFFDDNLGRSMACKSSRILTTGTCPASYTFELFEVEYLWSAEEELNAISAPNTTASPNFNDPELITNRSPYLSTSKRRYIFTWNDLNNNGIVDDSDGLPGTGALNDEIIHFEPSTAGTGVNWDTIPVDATTYGPRGSVANDFDLASGTEVDNLITWLRGQDWPFDEAATGDMVAGDGPLREPLRSRIIPDSNSATGFSTWRLGDIIHSTPMTVASPAEGYHLIYNDYSYAQFLNRHKRRRHIVYFGANDGMLHAVNAGFYSQEDRTFCLAPLDPDGTCPSSDTGPALGAEMWSYVPYNLVPHLKCLSSPNYIHKYYVDQRPRIFDAQIFEEEGVCKSSTDLTRDPGCIHPNGWGTILVGGMRFGGEALDADELDGVSNTDDRMFSSSWFILDITDPENPPTLLGELTFKNDDSTVDLGFTSGMPTMVIMKDEHESHWYLVFGSGPTDDYTATPKVATKGISDQEPRIAILPLDRLIDRPQVTDWNSNIVLQASTKDTLRIPGYIDPANPDVADMDTDGAGTIPLHSSPDSFGFVSDMITVDYDINPSYEKYKSDVVYFGTVEGDFTTRADGRTIWDGGGKLYRLVVKDATSTVYPLGITDASPYGRGTIENSTVPADWQIKKLIDLYPADQWFDDNSDSVVDPGETRPPFPRQVITAAPSVGTDRFNFWVYFGTGRFFDVDDKTDDSQHSYYGIREPAIVGQATSGGVTTKFFTWEEVERPYSGGTDPGDKGLWDVTEILVGQSPRITSSRLDCESVGTACLPDIAQSTYSSTTSPRGGPYLSVLDKFIGGTSVDTYNSSSVKTRPPTTSPCSDGCTDGWVNDFDTSNPRERNVGQATLLGGLVTYTTYQPFLDSCQAEGNAYLYAQYYRTGTAWHKNIFGLPEGLTGTTGNFNVKDKLDLGRGLATTPNLHVGAGEGSGDGGPTAFVQTSTGEILEIEQENLPIDNYRTGRSKWREYQP